MLKPFLSLLLLLGVGFWKEICFLSPKARVTVPSGSLNIIILAVTIFILRAVITKSPGGIETGGKMDRAQPLKE